MDCLFINIRFNWLEIIMVVEEEKDHHERDFHFPVPGHVQGLEECLGFGHVQKINPGGLKRQ